MFSWKVDDLAEKKSIDLFTKGQLISIFCCLQFSQKTNENNST
jgi:hypothetical protein